MTLARWTENLELGVPSIDEDHRGLFEAINRLHFIDDKPEDAAAMAQAIADVIEYTRGHFRREEMLMRLAGYPEYEAHCALHRKAAQRAAEWEKRCLAQPTCTRVRAFAEALADWLYAHVLNEDVKLKPYIDRLDPAQAA